MGTGGTIGGRSPVLGQETTHPFHGGHRRHNHIRFGTRLLTCIEGCPTPINALMYGYPPAYDIDVGVTPCGYPLAYVRGWMRFRADTGVCPYDTLCPQFPGCMVTRPLTT